MTRGVVVVQLGRHSILDEHKMLMHVQETSMKLFIFFLQIALERERGVL